MKYVPLSLAVVKLSDTVGDFILTEKWKFKWPAQDAMRKIGLGVLGVEKYIRVEAVDGMVTLPDEMIDIETIFFGDFIPDVTMQTESGVSSKIREKAYTQADFRLIKNTIQLSNDYTGYLTVFGYCTVLDSATGEIMIPEPYLEAVAYYLEAFALNNYKWKILQQQKMLRAGLSQEIQRLNDLFWTQVRALKSLKSSNTNISEAGLKLQTGNY